MCRRPIIWLFREASNEDSYTRAFNDAGFDTQNLQVLATDFLDLPKESPIVDAVVVTSARAVTAIRDWSELHALKALPWFSIGPATRLALESLSIQPEINGAGSASALAECIVKSGVKRVLFLAGDPHREELPVRLRESGLELQISTVYRTAPVTPSMPSDTRRPDWVAFFSPRGVSAVAEGERINLDGVAKAAIGPTTAEAMRKWGWPPLAIAATPDSDSLVRAISSATASIY